MLVKLTVVVKNNKDGTSSIEIFDNGGGAPKQVFIATSTGDIETDTFDNNVVKLIHSAVAQGENLETKERPKDTEAAGSGEEERSLEKADAAGTTS